jgi:hypothetical protein
MRLGPSSSRNVPRLQGIPLVAALALIVAACAIEPEIRANPDSNLTAARRLLAERSAVGPVHVVIERPPALLGEGEEARRAVARLAAEGVRGLSPEFTADPVPGPTLVLAFDTGPAVPLARVCAPERPPLPAAGAADVRLRAVFCDGGIPVAEVTGAAPPTRDAAERLVWRSTARLFPDDYPERYGLNLFGDRLRFGLGGSYGF